MDKNLKTIGDRIKYIRKFHKMTQKDIADKTNIKRGNLSHYENNKVTPGAEAIVELSELFNVSTDWLLTGKGEEVNDDVERFQNKSTHSLGELARHEIELIQKYRQLEPREQGRIEGRIEGYLEDKVKRGGSSTYPSGEEAATREKNLA
jgi:transcriptional regulator with XRE-family HTH domain